MSGASGMRTPPAGTRCVDCRKNVAVLYAGDDPVCWECDQKGATGPVDRNDDARPEARPEPKAVEKAASRRGMKRGGVLCAWEGCTKLAYAPRRYCTAAHDYWNHHEARMAARKETRTPEVPKVAEPLPVAAQIAEPKPAEPKSVQPTLRRMPKLDYVDVLEAYRIAGGVSWREQVWTKLRQAPEGRSAQERAAQGKAL